MKGSYLKMDHNFLNFPTFKDHIKETWELDSLTLVDADPKIKWDIL